VNLDPPIARAEGDELQWAVLPLVELAIEAGWEVIFEQGPEARGGYSVFDTHVLSINSRPGFSINQQVKTLIHELSHMLLRVERQDVDLELTYSEEELVVEVMSVEVV
jgi:hypothetical protein